MSSFIGSCLQVARRNVAGSLSAPAWKEVLAAAAWLLAALAGWSYGGQLSELQQLILWSLLLVGLAVLLRHSGAQLFGPVLFYELIQLARRSRYFLLRCLYALALLFILYAVYLHFLEEFLFRQSPFRGGVLGPRARDMAELGEWFYYTFMMVQFAVVLLLTPAYTASAISEEKDRKTLEFLLATDLHNREIVLSKLVARLANMGLIILTGLPVLSLTQLLGGVDPNLVLAGFAASAVTLASLGSYSILCSVYARKSRDAIILAYLGIVIYYGLASLVHSTPILAGPAADVLNSGNLYAALAQLRDDVALGKNLANSIPGVLRHYAIFHGVLALLFTTWAVVRLRAVALRTVPRGSQWIAPSRSRLGRRRVGYLPMLWKEIHIEPGFRLNRLGWVLLSAGVGLSLVPALWILGTFLEDYIVESLSSGSILYRTQYSRTQAGMNFWARLMGSCLGSLMLLGVAVRAAGSVSGERDRGTLDGLLTSPLESHDILFAKWLGSLLSVRWAWPWLALVWVFGLLSGGLSPFAVFLLLIAWIVYAGTLAGVGLWFSTRCASTLRATLATLVVTAVIGAAPGILWMFCLPFNGSGPSELAGLMSPPVVLYTLAGTVEEFEQLHSEVRNVLCLFGLFFWALAAVAMWSVTRKRFRMISSRLPYRRPAPVPQPLAAFHKQAAART